MATWPIPILRRTGVPPLDPMPADEASGKTAEIAKKFLVQAKQLLADQPMANCPDNARFFGQARPAQLRGGLRIEGCRDRSRYTRCTRAWPDWSGWRKSIGDAGSLAEEIDVLEKSFDDYDFFFVHFKYTDSRGEDGDFAAKVKMIEEFDGIIPRVEALKPSVIVRHRRPQHPRRDGKAIVGTRCPRSWRATTAATTPVQALAKRPHCKEDWDILKLFT